MGRVGAALGQLTEAVPTVPVARHDRVELGHQLIAQRRAVGVTLLEHHQQILRSVAATRTVRVGMGGDVYLGAEVVRFVAVLEIAVVPGIGAHIDQVVPARQPRGGGCVGGRGPHVGDAPVDVLLPTALPPIATRRVPRRGEIDPGGVTRLATKRHGLGRHFRVRRGVAPCREQQQQADRQDRRL
jgi:hypothetical protein